MGVFKNWCHVFPASHVISTVKSPCKVRSSSLLALCLSLSHCALDQTRITSTLLVDEEKRHSKSLSLLCVHLFLFLYALYEHWTDTRGCFPQFIWAPIIHITSVYFLNAIKWFLVYNYHSNIPHKIRHKF